MHNSLGHFGAKKSYATLCEAYYWPNMQKNIVNGYVPSCAACQHNKPQMTKATGPLHPLPVSNAHENSIAINFVGPLPSNHGSNCITTITDQLNSDIHLIPTTMEVLARNFAGQFFHHWYCKNGLPLEIISDCDAKFVSEFWHGLCTLSGVKHKMLSAYHPQMDGALEQTNKTVIQSLQFHVDKHQTGWVDTLPLVRFNMINTIIASTGYTHFQLHLSCSPRLIPPITCGTPVTLDLVESVEQLLQHFQSTVFDARDNIWATKVNQSASANLHQKPDPILNIGDHVLLSTFH